MTALSLPTCAVPFMTGCAYPFRSNLWPDAATLLAQSPLLPENCHWCGAEELCEPCLRLDVGTAALLLYPSFLDPMATDDESCIAAIHAELGASHGDTRHARLVVAVDAEQQPEVSAARLRACTVRAARLLKTEA